MTRELPHDHRPYAYSSLYAMVRLNVPGSPVMKEWTVRRPIAWSLEEAVLAGVKLDHASDPSLPWPALYQIDSEHGSWKFSVDRSKDGVWSMTKI